jgi:hypothetical protein
MAMGLTQPVIEMSTTNVSGGGKGGKCIWLTTLPHSCADCLAVWEPQPPGTLRACNKIALLLPRYMKLIAWGVFLCVFAYVNVGP